MTDKFMKNISRLPVFLMTLTACVFFLSMVSYAAAGEETQIPINVNVSAKIINLDSERGGDIRIYTSVRYSLYATSGHSIFVYFNGGDSPENIRPTRDSLGNLILRFSLEELLKIEGSLKPNEFNHVQVVVSMETGSEYMGESEVYLTKKR